MSRKLKLAQWGDATVDQLAKYLHETHSNLNGFSRRSLYGMRQFYETYIGFENVSTPLTQIP